MNELALLQNYLAVGAILFALGMIGFLVRRNLIVMFLCVELMLQGISLSVVAWGRFHQDWGGQMLVVFIITVAACEAAVGLALILMLFQRAKTLDIAFWQDTRETGQAAYIDHGIPEETEPTTHWPTLTVAGREPEWDEEELLHRRTR